MRDFVLILFSSFLFFTMLFNDSLQEYFEQKYHKNIFFENAFLLKFSDFKNYLEEDVFFIKKQKTLNEEAKKTQDAKNESIKLRCQSFSFYFHIEKPKPKPKKIKISKNDGIIILGDSLMQGVGISICNKAKKFDLKCKNIAKQSTGILRKKYYNYAYELEKALIETNYKTIVVLVGLNDTWNGMLNHKSIKFASKNWIKFYESRVDELANLAIKYKAKLFWYELPIIKNEEEYKKVQLINSIFKSRADAMSFYFIRLDSILTQDFNYYIQYENKSRRIRLNDGIHFTPLGYSLVSKSFFDMVQIDE